MLVRKRFPRPASVLRNYLSSQKTICFMRILSLVKGWERLRSFRKPVSCYTQNITFSPFLRERLCGIYRRAEVKVLCHHLITTGFHWACSRKRFVFRSFLRHVKQNLRWHEMEVHILSRLGAHDLVLSANRQIDPIRFILQMITEFKWCDVLRKHIYVVVGVLL